MDERRPPASLNKKERDAFFTRVVQEHSRFLFRVAFSVLRNADDAEDAVQEAFLKLYRSAKVYDMQNERAFLARVVWRAALDRKTARGELAEDGAAEFQLRDERASPEEAVSDWDRKMLLQEWVEQLPEELRVPLLLSSIEEMNSREISELMSLPEGTVRTRLMRARAELRKRWEAGKYKTQGVLTR